VNVPTSPDDIDGTPPAVDEPVDDTPTITCSRCDRTWELTYELETLYAGNQAFEQFALDHKRHTGHFPDDVSPWLVDCQQCRDEDAYLDERPARRWAETHARHTGHPVDLSYVAGDVDERIEPDSR
jgi:hypothetical protein